MITAERKFRPDIEGLRAVAVGLVVLGHARVPGFEGGYIGVDVFFVLSGFLITGLLLRERASTGSISMAGFYARRARRILPAASIVLVVTVLASYEWLGFLRGAEIAEDGKWAAVFAANLRFASEGTQYLNLTAPPSPLQHYWSLAVEEQFYLVWPIVFLIVVSVAPRMRLAAKLAAVLALIIVASFAWSVVQTDTNPVWAFFSPLTRAWELALGSLLAVGVPQLRRLPLHLGPWLSWIGLTGVIGGAFVLDNGTAFPGYAAALPVAGTALVVAGGTIAPRGGAERLLALVPFQVLGKWSYSLYLWHWPVLIIAEQRAGQSLALAQNLGLVALGLGLAVITHYAIENPVRFARPLARNPWSSLSVGVCLVVAAYGLSAWQLGVHAPARPPVQSAQAAAPGLAQSAVQGLSADSREPRGDPVEEVLALVSASTAINELPGDLVLDLRSAATDFAWFLPAPDECLVDPEILESPPCIFGDPDGSRTVVLFGDSHAAQWLQALDDIGERMHWKVIMLGKAGCPAATVDFRRAYQTATQRLVGPPPDCVPWMDNAISRINETRPDVVILASCNGCEYMVDANDKVLTRSAWGAGIEETLQRITAPNTTKVVLGDTPRLKGSVDCLALHQNNVQACAEPVGPLTAATYNDIERSVAETAGVAFIDVTSWFCGSVCSPVIGNMVVYTNDYHVTATYARHLSWALESVLGPIVESGQPVQASSGTPADPAPGP
ncbi:MAG: acyltransferase [Dehalococcoidia bacterium]|nr:acyltransferase [Dehalococcoidia bacterium]